MGDGFPSQVHWQIGDSSMVKRFHTKDEVLTALALLHVLDEEQSSVPWDDTWAWDEAFETYNMLNSDVFLACLGTQFELPRDMDAREMAAALKWMEK